ncbi:MAG: glutamine-synthetase adenylyltransferase, partial [Pseudomonadota bacterium]
IFRRLAPKIATRLATAKVPDEALVQFDRFLSGLPAGVQVFSLFEANPDLLDLLVEICAVAPRLAGYLGRHANVLDAVLAPDFFQPLGDAADLAAELTAALQPIDDYERRLDLVRVWVRERHFRIGVQALRGIAAPEAAARDYANLAEASLRALLPVVTEDVARRFGPPPGAGLAVLGMGKLGSREMTAASDLDLIMIYDAAGVEASEGPKSLAAPAYYARLTKTLLSALTVPTAEGGLYEVDMRLRPSGRQGPVATSLASFAAYQRSEAWTWEHLALTRARLVAASSADLGARVEAAVADGLGAARPALEIMADVRDMRRRLLEAKGGGDVWEVKAGPGRLLDMDLFLQAGALVEGLRGVRAPQEMVSALEERAFLGGADAERLREAYRIFSTVQHLARVAVDGELRPEKIGAGLGDVLTRGLDMPDLATLEARMGALAAEAAALIDRGVGA